MRCKLVLFVCIGLSSTGHTINTSGNTGRATTAFSCSIRSRTTPEIRCIGAIRPTDGYLHLDRAPTSVQNGYIYTYQYDKDIGLTSATDQVPFNNTVFRAMVPAWVQIWKRDRRNEFDPELFKGSFGRAARLLGEQGPRTSWSPRPVQANSDFIFGD
jgi:hypothetical protein